jgi:hypothetical protein
MRVSRKGEKKYRPAGSIYTYKDVEWTKKLAHLDFEDEKTKEDWRVGISGSNLLLTELNSERSFVLQKGLEFNLFCNLQVIRHFDTTRKVFYVLYVLFDEVSF